MVEEEDEAAAIGVEKEDMTGVEKEEEAIGVEVVRVGVKLVSSSEMLSL